MRQRFVGHALTRAAITLLIMVGLYLSWLTFWSGSETVNVVGDAILLTMIELTSAAMVLAAVYQARRSLRASPGQFAARTLWSPALIGMAILLFAVGDVIWAYYDLARDGDVPFPSIADIAYVAGYPMLLMSIALIPSSRQSTLSRLRTLLDGGVYFALAAVITWFFIIAPTLEAGGTSTWAIILATAYPVGDLAIVACLLLLWLYGDNRHLRTSFALLAAGLGLVVAADTVFNYQTIRGGYLPGTLVDGGWAIGYALLGLGGFALVRAISAPAAAAPARLTTAPAGHAPQPLWLSLLPYACLPLFGALYLYAWQTSTDLLYSAGVATGGLALVLLVVARQVLEIVDNARLHRIALTYVDQLEALNGDITLANARLESLATTDALTELSNHRAMIAAVDQEVERAIRFRRPFSLLVIDIDHFKGVNDSYGHLAGDALIRQFASTIRSMLRGVDTAGRWGGEEFLITIPETNLSQAVAVAERIRAAVAGGSFDVGAGVHLTCSIGVASYPEYGADREQLIMAADQALYAAKRLGRNQVRSADDPAIAALANDSADATSREAEALAGTAEALASLVEARDRYTGSHAHDVSSLAVRVAVAMGLDATASSMMKVAGRLHDIGKVVVPDAILSKPGALTAEEWAIIKQHPMVGHDVVNRIPALRAIAPLIRSHHEHWDGTGYPEGLAGEAIPLGARILAVVDAYSAITSDRPYQVARSSAWALAELRRVSGTQLDPAIVHALERVLAADACTGGLTDAERPAHRRVHES